MTESIKGIVTLAKMKSTLIVKTTFHPQKSADDKNVE